MGDSFRVFFGWMGTDTLISPRGVGFFGFGGSGKLKIGLVMFRA